MLNNDNKYIDEKPPAVIVGALNLVRALGFGEFPVIIATSMANETAFSSKYLDRSYEIPGPTNTPYEFIQSLQAIGNELTPVRPVLFYNGDADLLAISRNRDVLSNYYRFNMPPPDVVESLVDKSLFFNYMEKYDLPTPKTVLIGNEKFRDTNIVNDFILPVVVKPVSRVGWFDSSLARKFGKGGKAILVTSRKELRAIITASMAQEIGIIIQEHIIGDETFVVSYHSYVDNDGNILGEYSGRKHRTYPNRFGKSTCVEVCDIPDVLLTGRKIIEKTGLIGVSKIDFKRCPETGQLYLLEINPRFNLWNYPAAVSGVNLPLIAYNDIMKIKEQCSYYFKHNTKWIDGELDRRSFKEEGKGIFLYYISSISNLFSNTVYNVWAWNDPMPFVKLVINRFISIPGKVFKRVKRNLV